MEPWRHFVPLKADLSDALERGLGCGWGVGGFGGKGEGVSFFFFLTGLCGEDGWVSIFLFGCGSGSLESIELVAFSLRGSIGGFH